VLAEKIAEAKVKVTNQEIQNYYNQNKKSFKGKSLAAVKKQITTAIKQQNAEPPTQLLAELAKSDKLSVEDKSYQSLVSQIENPSATSLTGQ
ncbi:MAG: hypothetical protein K6T83_23875, partial [Alicyclobacillus sp.]|nr:hypothetical protein [Alicyclobacillus sp.]